MGRTYRDVTASAPCPACGHKDWCAWDGDLLRCQRPAESSSPEGLRRIDQGPDHVLYAPERAPAVSRRGPRKRNDPPPATLAALAVRCRGQLDHERLELLATGLGVCASSLQRVGIGWALRADLEPLGAQWEGKRPNWAWTFPEFDGQGRLCGLCLRADDGRKSSPASSRTGARRGLSMPVDEQLRPVLSDGPVLVVEGASDVAAACCLGLTAVGRPSNSGGTDELAVLLKDREVLVVGENDAKQSGEWPGKEGALRVAVGLSGQWGKPAHWVLPPAGVKDLRELLRRRVAEGLLLDDEAACRAAGADLLNGLQSACQAASKEGRRVVIKPMNSYESRPVGWLWRDHIPLGKTTLIGGDPNLGKSFLTLDFAARVSAGRTWPDGSPCPAGDVLILSAEDDPADTIRPRLEAADANLDRISILHTVEDRGGTSYFDLTRDLEALQEGIERLENPRLVIIDPIGAYLGQTNENRNSEVRTVLAAMGEMAARSGVAVVMVMHLNKASDMKAMYRYSGSIAFVAAPRAAWMVAKDKNDPGRRLFVPSKLNIVKDPRGWAYRIMEGDAGPRVEWLDDEVRETADDLLGGGDGGVRRATRRVEAAEWLQEYLTDGPVPASEVKDAGRAVGFTDVTLERAKRELGVESCKVGMDGGWCWQLAEQGHESRDGRCHEDDHFHPPSGDHLRRKGPPRGFFDDGAPASGDHLRLESAPEGPKPGAGTVPVDPYEGDHPLTTLDDHLRLEASKTEGDQLGGAGRESCDEVSAADILPGDHAKGDEPAVGDAGSAFSGPSAEGDHLGDNELDHLRLHRPEDAGPPRTAPSAEGDQLGGMGDDHLRPVAREAGSGLADHREVGPLPEARVRKFLRPRCYTCGCEYWWQERGAGTGAQCARCVPPPDRSAPDLEWMVSPEREARRA